MNNYMIMSNFVEFFFPTGLLILMVVLPIWITLIVFGVKMCSKNNAIGMILLFISINLLGLVIGFALLYNSKDNPVALKRKEEKLKQKLENFQTIKPKNNIPPQS